MVLLLFIKKKIEKKPVPVSLLMLSAKQGKFVIFAVLHWGLNPGPLALKSSTLLLGY